MKNKTVLITGASRGIGAETAKTFAENGYDIIINYIRSEKAAKILAEELKNKYGIEVNAIQADISKKPDVDRMFFEIKKQYPAGIDVLVNNAGIAGWKLFDTIEENEYDRMMDVNVKGTFLCSQAAVPLMIRKKSGRIINISSVWGIVGASCETHYSASKAAVIGFTKALAKEFAPSGVTVNCIAPGVIDTDMNKNVDISDMGKIGKPADIAACVLFLAGENAGFITGQVIRIDGGKF